MSLHVIWIDSRVMQALIKYVPTCCIKTCTERTNKSYLNYRFLCVKSSSRLEQHHQLSIWHHRNGKVGHTSMLNPDSWWVFDIEFILSFVRTALTHITIQSWPPGRIKKHGDRDAVPAIQSKSWSRTPFPFSDQYASAATRGPGITLPWSLMLSLSPQILGPMDPKRASCRR